MTNRAVIYRPNSRWQIVAAFSVAITLHLCAVAVASLRHEVSTVNPGDRFAVIDVDPGEELPAPPQTEIPVSPTTTTLQDFVEPQVLPQPNPKKQPIIPIRAIGQTPLGAAANARTSALYAPRPEYPYEARSHHIIGSGVAVVHVDPDTGFIDDVAMEQTIGSPILDNATLSAFKRWRFKKGTLRKVRVPITFNLTGAQF